MRPGRWLAGLPAGWPDTIATAHDRGRLRHRRGEWRGRSCRRAGRGSNDSTIEDAYATGAVTGGAGGWVGGLVGDNDGGTIEDAYATGTVTGGQTAMWRVGRDRHDVGGMVGGQRRVGTIEDAYATGAVTGGEDSDVGGLIGSTPATRIRTIISAPRVRARRPASAIGQGRGVTGLSTAQLEAALAGFSSDRTWSDVGGQTTPVFVGISASNRSMSAPRRHTLDTDPRRCPSCRRSTTISPANYVLAVI